MQNIPITVVDILSSIVIGLSLGFLVAFGL